MLLQDWGARLLPASGGLAVLLLAACAAPGGAADSDFKRFLDDNARVAGIAFEVERAAVPYCDGHVHYAGGVFLAHPDIAIPRYRDAALRLLGGDGVTVYAVVPGSPAAQAGLAAGDIVDSIDGVRARDALTAGASGAPHEVWQVHAAGGPRTVDYTPVPVCDYPVRLVVSDKFAAGTDGRRIAVTTGLVETTTADELALVIGHETAHIVMGHFQGGRLYHVMRSVPPSLDPRFALELEADYVGSYLAAAAHYDMRRALALWGAVPDAEPDAAHPPTALRVAFGETVVAEIERKQAAGIALVPDGLRRADAGGAQIARDINADPAAPH